MTGIDWNKVNSKAQQLEQKLTKKSGGGAKFWRPRDGENRIRVLTGWATEGDFVGQFWREVAQHWGVSESQSGPIVCPKETPYLEGDCPICDFVEALKSKKGDLAAQELVKDLRAKTAYLLNVVDLKDPVYTANDVAEYKKSRPENDVPFAVGDTKVQVFAAPSTVFNQILNACKANQMDITDPMSGNDVSLTKMGKGLTTKYTLTVMLRSTPAPADATPVPLNEIGRVLPEDKMLELLAEGPGGAFAGLLGSGGSSNASHSLPTGADDDDGEDLAASLRSALND